MKTFKRVGPLSYGYETQAVDAFFDRFKKIYSSAQIGTEQAAIREVAFKWVLRGYDGAEVDAALARLETALIHKRRKHVVESAGEQQWLTEVYDSARTLYPRMSRPRLERFAAASGRGYEKTAVDSVIDQLALYFDGKVQITASDLRNLRLPKARNSKAYSEAVVDAYLERAIAVLVAVE